MNRFSAYCLVSAQLALVSASAHADEPASPQAAIPASSPAPDAAPLSPAPPASPPALSSAPETRPPAPVPATALVHLDAELGVGLEMGLDGYRSWRQVCYAPCDVQLPIDRRYRFVGDAIRTSGPFFLGANGGEGVTLTPSTASKSTFRGGLTLIVLGGVATFGALIAAGIVASEANPCSGWDPSPDCRYQTPGHPSYVAEYVIGGIGVALVVGGLAMVISNHSTYLASKHPGADVGQRRRTVVPPAPLPSREDSVRMPRVTQMPLFRMTF